MKYPYSKKFMADDTFENLITEMCSACEAEMESGGSEVLLGNLAKIHEYSGELMGMLARGEEVEDWVEDKISKASQSMSDVKHYIEYKNSGYGMHNHSLSMHGMDVSTDQRASVSGRLPGDRMPVMTQEPAMTPQSSMEGGCVSDMSMDDEMLVDDDPMDMLPPAPEEEEDEMIVSLAEVFTMEGSLEDLGNSMASSLGMDDDEFGDGYNEESISNEYHIPESLAEELEVWSPAEAPTACELGDKGVEGVPVSDRMIATAIKELRDYIATPLGREYSDQFNQYIRQLQSILATGNR